MQKFIEKKKTQQDEVHLIKRKDRQIIDPK
jgi:hypothetical protein